MKIAVIFANGTEEIEALTPVDVLRRAKIDVDVVSINGIAPTGSHNIKVVADRVIENTYLNDYDGIVIPGGMPGATNISENEDVVNCLKNFMLNGKMIASICASPAVVLANKGVIANKRVTCYPSINFVSMLKNNFYTEKDVEVDGNLITANGPKSAFEFSLKIVEYLGKTISF